MEKKDLMIGDWVQYTQNCYTEKKGVWSEVHYGRVCSVGLLYVKVDRGSVAIEPEIVKPIPLTAEILEKNGFIIKHPESEKRTYLKDRAGQITAQKNRGVLFFDISGNPKKFGWYHPMFSGHIYFVHELQHALRLCGIEKEIEL